MPEKGGMTKKWSVMSVFLMSLFNRQNLLDNHQFFFFADIIKHGITPGDVETGDGNPAFQDQFFLISLTSRERVFFKPFQGSFDDPACLFRQAINLIR